MRKFFHWPECFSQISNKSHAHSSRSGHARPEKVETRTTTRKIPHNCVRMIVIMKTKQAIPKRANYFHAKKNRRSNSNDYYWRETRRDDRWLRFRAPMRAQFIHWNCFIRVNSPKINCAHGKCDAAQNAITKVTHAATQLCWWFVDSQNRNESKMPTRDRTNTHEANAERRGK